MNRAGILAAILLVLSAVPGRALAAAEGKWVCSEDGRWFHQSESGWLDTGWFQDTDGGWYQLAQDGAMLAARWFQDVDGSWYYLNVDGRMLAGQWMQDGNSEWYYLGMSGAMLKSCVTPDGYTLMESGNWDRSVPRKETGVVSSRGSGGSSGGSGGSRGSSNGNGSASGNSSTGESSNNRSDLEEEAVSDSFASPSDAKEAVISWRVCFTDRETHQIALAPDRFGTIQDGEELAVNFRRRIIDSENRIWEAREESPVTVRVYGPGNWLYYVEYEQTGTLPDRENPFEDEEKRLAEWLETAKTVEAVLTGEEPEKIPDSRFVVEHMGASDDRLLTIADQIPVGEEQLVYVIGKNMVPNGIILEKLYRDEMEYAHLVEDTIQIGADIFCVSRFTIQRKADAENCHHQFTEKIASEATCLRKGITVYTCDLCGFQQKVITAALGHEDADENAVCDRCGMDADEREAEKVHWNIGDVQAREIDGEIYLFRCIDQNYADGMETHRESALFLCDSVIPADFGSDYYLETDENGRYDYRFVPGPIVNFGEESDYKYSAIREWLTELEENFFNTEPVNIGVSRAYTGSTGAKRYSQLQESELTGSEIGSQRLSGKLFILSVDEALCYKDYLWKFDGSEEENPESQIGPFCKGYWLRTPEGNSGNHDTGKVYIVDLVNGNLHPCEVLPEGDTADEELKVTGTTGVRLAFTMPQD